MFFFCVWVLFCFVVLFCLFVFVCFVVVFFGGGGGGEWGYGIKNSRKNTPKTIFF